MDLANAGRQTQNDTETRAIRGVMIQKREALRAIEREMAQLAENKREIEEDLVRLGITLAPHNHSVLPNEVLSHIFVLLALDHGSVEFPISKNNGPPQFVVSQVCSHWRRVALRTPRLWSDTHLIYPPQDASDIIRIHQRWLFRARTFPVTLSITFCDLLDEDELTNVLQTILLRIHIKRLNLHLIYEHFKALSTLPEAALSHLSEFELDVTFPDHNVNVDMVDPHPFITRLQSITFHFDGHNPGAWISSLRPCLPWSQLRSLDFGASVDDLSLVFGILRQTSVLEALTLSITNNGVLEQVTMPSLRNLTMEFEPGDSEEEVDQILRNLACPSLTELSLETYGSWTCETFEILKQQYNMPELREATIYGGFVLPVSAFLLEAPMLHSLSLGWDAIMDDEAVIGVSSGSLGRFLRRLSVKFPCSVGEVLSMAEARKKMVDELMENGCSWREEITVLNDVVIQSRDRTGYEERIIALKEAGIAIIFL